MKLPVLDPYWKGKNLFVSVHAVKACGGAEVQL
jgi:hypothetical protein